MRIISDDDDDDDDALWGLYPKNVLTAFYFIEFLLPYFIEKLSSRVAPWKLRDKTYQEGS